MVDANETALLMFTEETGMVMVAWSVYTVATMYNYAMYACMEGSICGQEYFTVSELHR